MNRSDRRRIARKQLQVEADLTSFSERLSRQTFELIQGLPVLADNVSKGFVSFNPGYIQVLDDLAEEIAKTRAILAAEGTSLSSAGQAD